MVLAEKWSLLEPFRKASNWMSVATEAAQKRSSFEDLVQRVSFNPEFATKLYDLLTPGATSIVTDEAALRKALRDLTIMTTGVAARTAALFSPVVSAWRYLRQARSRRV
jgi:hypothetical protein